MLNGHFQVSPLSLFHEEVKPAFLVILPNYSNMGHPMKPMVPS